jgi:peptide/nickel transport system substrate-binding protein
MDGTYDVPGADGSGRDRAALRRALTLLEDAGYTLVDGIMTEKATGKPLTFEMLVATPDQERLALAYVNFLKRAGIRVSVRQVDSAQFERRRQTFDFEQKFYWGSEAAATEGTRNYMGVADPAVDAMIDAMLEARDREAFVDATRALDRLLMSGTYVVPLFHLPKQWVGRWARIERPERVSLYGYELDSWWNRDASGGGE